MFGGTPSCAFLTHRASTGGTFWISGTLTPDTGYSPAPRTVSAKIDKEQTPLGLLHNLAFTIGFISSIPTTYLLTAPGSEHTELTGVTEGVPLVLLTPCLFYL